MNSPKLLSRIPKSDINKSKTKKFLLANADFKNIYEAKKSFNLKYANEVYDILLEDYNTFIDSENEKKPYENEDDIQHKLNSKLQRKLVRDVNDEYNNLIVNTPFVNATMSNQISRKFALSEYSMQTKYDDFLRVIKNKLMTKYGLLDEESGEKNSLSFKRFKNDIFPELLFFYLSIYEATDIEPEGTAEKLIQRIYGLLMLHSGQFNRIFITDRNSGVVKSSKLIDNFTYKDFENVCKDIIQSAGLAVLGNLVFTIQQRNIPEGGSSVDVPDFLKNKRGVSTIINDDDLCGQRCLVLADCQTNDDLRQMKTAKSESRFNKKVLEMCSELKIKGRMSFLDFDDYADKRRKQVIILSGLFVEMYSTPTEYEEQLYIYYDTAINHYHFIHDINAASNDSKRNNKWCKACKKSIRREHFNTHKCKETLCICCRTNFCSLIEKEKHFSDARKNKSWCQCNECNLWCADSDCLAKHLEKCKGEQKQCPDCKKWIDNEETFDDDGEIHSHFKDSHICGEKFCRNCESYYCGEHRCFITPIDPFKGHDTQDGVFSTWDQKIYAYDFESMFDENLKHDVNLCIVKRLYTDEKHIFYNIEDFVKFAVSGTRSTFIAHNGKAYDNWMVHKYIIKHTAHRPNKLILAGNKIMYMKVKSIRFIDSLNHIAQGLATFPKTFGLTEMKKGYFPYMFNIAENQNYIGKIPDRKYFNPENMSSDKFYDFNKWYETQLDVVYDFKKELFEYCESDVDILKRSLEIYIDDAIKVNEIHPLKCSTIASYCLRVFRTNYMKEKEIAVLTKEEYDFCKRGFFGGRTEVFKMFQSWTEQDIKEGKYGKYVDIQSLYPSVQFFDELPCGVPVWDNEPSYENTSEYINNHYGYIECDIVCPDNLHIPLLPEKKNNKLMFDLVNKDKKVYSSIELQRAIEVGYKATKIYRSLTFEKSDNIFKGYIRNFLKIKTESAGYSGDDIDDYIKRYNEHCGVLLEKDKIKKNPGMKLLAKICLNSLWGKFGQNDELPTTKYIKNDAWFKLLKRHADKKVELKNEILIDDDTLYVSYIEKEESQTSLMTSNLGLAGFVTANARLRLYKELYKLSERVIYCDTDSIIYEYDKSKYNVEEGDCLGQWELEENGNLKEVYALAPKTYGYTSLDGEQKYKCKGITLSYGNKIHFTYDKLKTLITGDSDGNREKIVTYSNDFIKDNKTGTIHTKENVPKDTNYNEDDFKRIFYKNGTSKPFTNIV